MTRLSPELERLRRNVSAIEWLSTAILHDLRNPVGAIYAAAEMLTDVDVGHAGEEARNQQLSLSGTYADLLTDLNGVARGKKPAAEIGFKSCSKCPAE
jgi:K+-sensing histidine kinase KdpD